MSPEIWERDKFLFKGALVANFNPPSVERVDLRVSRGQIEEMGTELSPLPDEMVLHLEGAVIIPGLVCGHTHLYSALACGMPMPASEPPSFAAMLKEVWWKLDKSLDLEAVEVSAFVGGIEALRSGVTTLIDHHASPNAIGGSLETIDRALGQLGLRRVLCYEVSDRDGAERALEGIEEHRRFLSLPQGNSSQGMRATLIGAHANFTLSDETLKRCIELAREAGVGLHIHVAEARDDAEITGESPVLRMERLGGLLPGSIFAHCVHLDSEELKKLEDNGIWIAHQPRSNMNNHVGYAPIASFPQNQFFLGTDGIGSDMLSELQFAWFQSREAELSYSPDFWLSALYRASEFAGHLLGVEIGTIAPGKPADLVIMSIPPGPPISEANLAATLIFRTSSRDVRSVMVGGKFRMWENEIVGFSEELLRSWAREVALAVWKRMAG